MATKFGVQLKSTGAPGDASARETRRPGARLGGNTTKPISDLKAMFDKDGKGSGAPPNTQPGTDFSKKTTTTKTTVSRTKSSGNSASPRGGGQNAGISLADQDAFNLLSLKLKESGIDGLLADENEEEEPVVAVAKVYGGSHAYQATVETKGKSSSDKDEEGPVAKTTVRSQLSNTLALMRIRPGSGKGERTLSRGSSFDDDTPPAPKTTGSGGSEIKTVSSVASESKPLFSVGVKRTEDVGNATRDRYIPGAPRGWRSQSTEASTTIATVSKSSYTSAYTAKTGDSQGASVTTVSSKFKSSTAPTPLTSGIGGGGGDLKLALGARSGGSLGRQSSDDNSSSSSGVSPRGVPTGPGNTGLSTTVGGRFSPRGSKQGDENSAIESFLSKNRTAQTNSETSVTNRYSPKVSKNNNRNQTESRTSSSPLTGKTDVTKNGKSGLTANDSKTPERKKTAWEQLSEDRKKFSKNRSSGSVSSDSDKGKKSPKPRGPEGKFKWMEKSRISLEEFKQQVNEGKKSQRSSSSESSSSLTRADGQGVKARIERFASPDHPSSGQQVVGVKVKDNNAKNRKSGETTIAPRTDFKKQTVRKINPQKFEDIKKGFEDKGKTGQDSPTTRRKLKLEIKPSKRLLERRQSFENPKSVPRQGSVDRIVISPRESGKVLETLKSLNDLQAAARVEKHPVRRTQSLRKASVEDEDVSSGSLYEDVEVDHSPYYHDIHGVRLAEDGQSNEGDISSEADQGIYEIISDIRGE